MCAFSFALSGTENCEFWRYQVVLLNMFIVILMRSYTERRSKRISSCT